MIDALPDPVSADQRPLVSVLLIAYRQEHLIEAALESVLAQDYSPLEIIVSDDCSPDRTFDVMADVVRRYDGPHRVILNRNEKNEGISAHLSKLARMSRGELLVVAAGDDVSAPERCRRLVEFWLAHNRTPDLISSDLVELDARGDTHARIAPTDLGRYRSFDDWLAGRPYVVGAAHAWSRRLFDRFGDMMPGAMAEDQIMTFRAIMTGGALSLREPLVRYRHGGLSRKRRWKTVDDFIARILQTNRFALAEVTQLIRDADTAGVGPRMRDALAGKIARESYTRDVFAAEGLAAKLRLLATASRVKPGFRIRMFLYAACPAVYAPVFALKRWLARDAR
ncbi:glycosyltransferase family 2 protein [Burkholderia ubonensis]|uniref:Glycosyl transferase family 2 n=1 Tax=Burkholderia ubonensis subsp. mesacidophila TaxID=265293 RepID=A0A2A4FIF0_9BURK|nr:glycosyltransferase [Burkholderia ubonensis]PCE32099.1 glycosyl transferase family 2 [Burkholderia ubonensis subsp. mesacidophila]